MPSTQQSFNHSPETADGITHDKADTQLGTRLGLWGDAQLNLKRRFRARRVTLVHMFSSAWRPVVAVTATESLSA